MSRRDWKAVFSVAHRDFELLVANGLGQKVEGAQADGFDGFVEAIECGEDDVDGLGPVLAGPRDQRPVRGDLVMFGSLTRRDETGIHRGLVEVLSHHRAALLDDSRNAVAVFAFGLFVQQLEDLLEPFDVAARFLEV